MRARHRRMLCGLAAACATVIGLADPVAAQRAVSDAPSAAFERFRFRFFEDRNSARDGLDTHALAALEGAERVKAEEMLIRFLPDTRGVIGLGVLRAKKAAPALTRQFDYRRGKPGFSVAAQFYLAHALWRITAEPRWASVLRDMLGSAKEWTDRLHAAEALSEVPDQAAVDALVKALDDAESLVRHHAGKSLLKLHGLPADAEGREHMLYRVMAEEAGRRDGGKHDILAAIAGRPIAAR